MGSPVKTERNRQIGQDYRAGIHMAELARRYGIAKSRVSLIVKQQKQNLSFFGDTLSNLVGGTVGAFF